MADTDKLTQAYIQKMMDIQQAQQQRLLTEDELKQVALSTGMTEEDWETVQASFQAHYDRGKGFMNHGNWEDAIQELEQAVTINPHHFKASNQLLQAYLLRYERKGDMDYALQTYQLAKRCLDMNAKDDFAIQTISQLKRDPKFRRELEKYETPPQEADISAIGLLQNKRVQITIAVLLSVFFLWWMVSMLTGKRPAENPYDSLPQSENSTAINKPENTAKSEERDEPSNTENTTQGSAIDYFNNANAKEEAGNHAGAIDDYTKAIELNPKFAEAYLNRGNLQFKLEYYAAAIGDFDKAIELNPNNASVFNNRGLAKFKTQDFEGAIADYNRAIRLNPQFSDAFLNRGTARYSTDDKTGACTDWRKALSLGNNTATQNIEQLCN
jgi:tetratricopeptide (TPR) repeat protein